MHNSHGDIVHQRGGVVATPTLTCRVCVVPPEVLCVPPPPSLCFPVYMEKAQEKYCLGSPVSIDLEGCELEVIPLHLEGVYIVMTL